MTIDGDDEDDCFFYQKSLGLEKRNEEETYTHFERDIRGKKEREKKQW